MNASDDVLDRLGAALKGRLTVLTASAAIVLLGGCSDTPHSDLLAPAPTSWRSVTPAEVASSFATKAEDRWLRYGETTDPYRLTGQLVALEPMKSGSYVAVLDGGASPVRLAGLYVPSRIQAAMRPGTAIAAFCKGVMIGPLGPGEAVLESHCWLDQDHYRAQGL